MAKLETAYLGGGCFWCLEAVFDRVAGVNAVESGYMGGRTANPTYCDVCTGTTGHVEVVRVTFDAEQITFPELLDIFFTIHDPTTMNRQGNDVGTQYRSVIFFNSDVQKREAEEAIARIGDAKIWPGPVVTALEPAKEFYIAEDYHQQYFENNASQPYCQLIVAPKVLKFQEKLKEKRGA